MYTRVLVVEDHPAGRHLIKGILERLGCRVDVSERIGPAVKLAGTHQYDVIFLDLSLPAMDVGAATAVLRGLQMNGKHRPIIALTDGDRQQNRKQLRASGLDDYITRPVSVEQFKAALKIWMDNSPAALSTVPA